MSLGVPSSDLAREKLNLRQLDGIFGSFLPLDPLTRSPHMEDLTSNLRRSTRKNVNKHPGLIVKNVRRTRSEIDLEKAQKKMEKALKESKKKDGIDRIARLEDRMAIDDAKEETSHPRHRAGLFPHFIHLGQLTLNTRCLQA